MTQSAGALFAVTMQKQVMRILLSLFNLSNTERIISIPEYGRKSKSRRKTGQNLSSGEIILRRKCSLFYLTMSMG